jgi:hypothetical protein
MLCVDVIVRAWHYCVVTNTHPTNATRPTCVAFASTLGHAFATCPTCIARDAYDAQRERERRERNDAYVTTYARMPIARALRDMRERERAPHVVSAWTRRQREHVDDPTCVTCLRPQRVCDNPKTRPCTRDMTRNAWERSDVHLGTHKAPDPTCHHPLVKCVHKW